MLGKLKGFKNFLKTAEKERLEAMVLENQNYFYDILPFAYVNDINSNVLINLSDTPIPLAEGLLDEALAEALDKRITHKKDSC